MDSYARDRFAARVSERRIVVSARGRKNVYVKSAACHLERDVREVLPDRGGIRHEHLADDEERPRAAPGPAFRRADRNDRRDAADDVIGIEFALLLELAVGDRGSGRAMFDAENGAA